MSGKPPFYKSARMATAAVVIAIYRDETPNPKDHPELLESNRLWFVMRKCWSPRPEDRPTALDVINDVRWFTYCRYSFASITKTISSWIFQAAQNFKYPTVPEARLIRSLPPHVRTRRQAHLSQRIPCT